MRKHCKYESDSESINGDVVMKWVRQVLIFSSTVIERARSKLVISFLNCVLKNKMNKKEREKSVSIQLKELF